MKKKVKITISIEDYMDEYMQRMKGGSKAEKLRHLIDDGIHFREQIDKLIQSLGTKSLPAYK